ADNIWSVAFSPDSSTILTASCDGAARLWDRITGIQLRVLKDSLEWLVKGFASGASPFDLQPRVLAGFSPDGNFIFTGRYDGDRAYIWDAKTGNLLSKLDLYSFDSAACSPDSTTILIGRSGFTALREDFELCCTAHLWDAATRNELRALKGHTNNITSVAFSPNGTTVLTGSYDGTARLWDVLSGKELKVLPVVEGSLDYTGYARLVAFRDDGETIVTVSDKNIRLWRCTYTNDVDCLRMRSLSAWNSFRKIYRLLYGKRTEKISSTQKPWWAFLQNVTVAHDPPIPCCIQ
ncbi:hypothetical protein H0W26_05975, partial [Candidatus Dependentiae bacterium]|nr:hypothetical protein [Candidatus Dependentiae bacterium]